MDCYKSRRLTRKRLGETKADFVFSFLNPVTEQYFQSVATKTVTQFKGIENVTGSSFADTITGNSADNRIDAGAGVQCTLKRHQCGR